MCGVVGFWQMLLLLTPAGELARHIEFFRPVSYWDAFELEGTVRGAFFNDGRNHDVLMYGLLRTDPRPWHPVAEAANLDA